RRPPRSPPFPYTTLFRSERARREGGPLNGIQAWVALPNEREEMEPTVSHHGIDELPTFDEAGVRARVIAGEAHGLKAAVNTQSPLFCLRYGWENEVRSSVPSSYPERAMYVASGAIEIDGQRFESGQMIVL